MPETKNDDPIAGALDGSTVVNQTPEDIDDFLSAHGIHEVSYVCTIKRFPTEGGSVSEWLPGSTKDGYPEIEEVGRRYGPGKYIFCFSWFIRNTETGKRERRMKEYKIALGPEWDDIHDEHMAEAWLNKKKRNESLRNRAEMEAALKGGTAKNEMDPKSAGLEYLREAKNTLNELGLSVGGSHLPASNNDNMYQLMMAMSAKSSENMMNMMMSMQQQTMGLITALISHQKPQSSDSLMKEVINMVSQTINLKEVLNPEKKGVVDRVFELMESLAPSLLALAQKPMAERRNNPIYQIATNSPEMEAMRNDPGMLNEMIKKWDKAHGAEQTNIILGTVGLKRPGTTPNRNAPQPEPEPQEAPEPEYYDSMVEGQTGEE